MCLVTRQTEPKVMENDLIVYKIVARDLMSGEAIVEYQSYYHYYLWKKGVLKETKMVTGSYQWCDCEKFDSETHDAYPDKSGKFTEVSEGFHAFKTKKRAGYSGVFLKQFLIPKGSLYYEDESGMIVSNQMMML